MPQFVNEAHLMRIRTRLLSANVLFTGIKVILYHEQTQISNIYGDITRTEHRGIETTMRFKPQQARRLLAEFNAFFEDVLPFEAYFEQDVDVIKDDRIEIVNQNIGEDTGFDSEKYNNHWRVVDILLLDAGQQYMGGRKVFLAPIREAEPVTPA